MKYLCLILFLVSSATVAVAQTPVPTNDASSLEVVKFSWSKDRIGWENDPFRGPIENFDEMRARTRNEKRITDSKRGGSGSPDKLQRDASADAANIAAQHKTTSSRYVFSYRTTVRNNSGKTIVAIDWDYVFLDKISNEQVGRHEFTSEEKIGPGKSKELIVQLRKPPSQTISITSLNKNEFESLNGHIQIVRIQYSDGSSWEANEKPNQ